MPGIRPIMRYAVPTFTLLIILIFGLFLHNDARGLLPLFLSVSSLGEPEIGQPSEIRVVEMEGLKMGETFPTFTTENGTIDDEFVTLLLGELRQRHAATLQETDSPPAYPECRINKSRYETLQQGSKDDPSQTLSIAINLHNSQAILPAQSNAILQALHYLSINHRIYVSLFENGSDDKTRALLSDFAAALDALEVDGMWMHSSRFLTSGMGDRITMLSEIRNHALRPLMPYAGSGTLIFMNDVATCPEDILELLYQRRLQEADVAVGTDWITLGNGKTTLYDLWATRGINGELPFLMEGDSGLAPVSTNNDKWMLDYWVTQNKPVRQRWLNGLPLPVYSAWGGMAAFDAKLFTVAGLRFRSSRPAGWEGGASSGSMGPWGKLINEPAYLDSDCPGDSECKLIFRDIWNLRNGKAKIALAPKTRTVYDVAHWAAMSDLATMWLGNADESELIDWNSVKAPLGVVCIASRLKSGEPVGAWDESNVRVRLSPVWVNATT